MRHARVILLFAAVPLFGHHSTAAEYDLNKVVTIQGVVAKVEWMNPHARFWLDVKDAAGGTTQWEVEMGSPNGLMRLGWTRSTIKPEDVITVDVSVAKDGSHHANARSVTLADGQVMSCGACGAMWALPLPTK